MLQRILLGDDSIHLVRPEISFYVPITGNLRWTWTSSLFGVQIMPSSFQVEDLSQLRDKMPHVEFLHLTSSKEELEEALAENSFRIEILLESQSINEEKLRLLTEKMKQLQPETTLVKEILATVGAKFRPLKQQ